MVRADGLDNVMSPNGPHPRYYVLDLEGNKTGPYGCYAEAEERMQSEDDKIVDHRGALIGDAGGLVRD